MKIKQYIILMAFVILLTACAATDPENNTAAEAPATPIEENTPAPDQTEPEAEEPTGEIKTIWIGPELAECTGVGPQTCMLIKWEQDADWQYFYSQIMGFTFEPGYDYEFIVEERKVENPPADGSSLEWILAEITSKTKVEQGMGAYPLDGTMWILTGYSQPLVDDMEISLTFDLTTGQVSGNSGCNTFFGGFTYEDKQIGFGPMGSTRMACEQEIMDQELLFLNLLAQVNAYEITDNQLTLTTADRETLIFIATDIE